jgi:hypothetical protein
VEQRAALGLLTHWRKSVKTNHYGFCQSGLTNSIAAVANDRMLKGTDNPT